MKIPTFRAIFLLIAASVLLTGCASNPLSTSGSLRVEVEVYKGPLSKKKRSQLGELVGVFLEAEKALHVFIEGVNSPACVAANADCKYLAGVEKDASELLGLTRVWIYNEPHTDYKESYKRLTKQLKEGSALHWYQKEVLPYFENEYAPGDPKLLPILRKGNRFIITATELASRFSNKAFYWANAQIGQPIDNPEVRRHVTGFTLLTSEYANQINARTTVLLKQMGPPGKSGEMLSVSDHLRDASPTAFLQLYNWYRGAADSDRLGPHLEAADRIKVAEELFSDRYWTRINQVQANGQGKVNMALIKDDIGNWNLKSFENDPGELLKAYRNLSYAGIKAITEIAKASSGTESLSMLGSLAQGNLGSTTAFNPNIALIEQYHQLTRNELINLRQGQGAALKEREDEVLEKQQQVKQAEQNLAQQEQALKQAPADATDAEKASLKEAVDNALENRKMREHELQSAEQELSVNATSYIEAARRILHEHRIRIETLGQVNAGSGDDSPGQIKSSFSATLGQ